MQSRRVQDVKIQADQGVSDLKTWCEEQFTQQKECNVQMQAQLGETKTAAEATNQSVLNLQQANAGEFAQLKALLTGLATHAAATPVRQDKRKPVEQLRPGGEGAPGVKAPMDTGDTR